VLTLGRVTSRGSAISVFFDPSVVAGAIRDRTADA
jgi:hypothetical protein